MLEEPRRRVWLAGPLERPFGRGVNLQITVSDAVRLHADALAAGVRPFLPPEERRYDSATDSITVRQFVIVDPDGHLLGFSEPVSVTPRDQWASSRRRNATLSGNTGALSRKGRDSAITTSSWLRPG